MCFFFLNHSWKDYFFNQGGRAGTGNMGWLYKNVVMFCFVYRKTISFSTS